MAINVACYAGLYEQLGLIFRDLTGEVESRFSHSDCRRSSLQIMHSKLEAF
jgi:hypothetical protein